MLVSHVVSVSGGTFHEELTFATQLVAQTRECLAYVGHIRYAVCLPLLAFPNL